MKHLSLAHADKAIAHILEVFGAEPASVMAEIRAIVFLRDDWICRYCNKRGGRLECDHIVPVSRGGSNDLSNFATACFSCNRSKRDKTLAEWRPDLVGL